MKEVPGIFFNRKIWKFLPKFVSITVNWTKKISPFGEKFAKFQRENGTIIRPSPAVLSM
jgi:hypothetical protein